jgi:hypothetical protein
MSRPALRALHTLPLTKVRRRASSRHDGPLLEDKAGPGVLSCSASKRQGHFRGHCMQAKCGSAGDEGASNIAPTRIFENISPIQVQAWIDQSISITQQSDYSAVSSEASSHSRGGVGRVVEPRG